MSGPEGPEFNPTSGQTPPPPPPVPPAYPQQAYPQQAYDPNQPYPPGYGYHYAATPPDLPAATAAMVWGIVAVAGGVVCGLPILASPVAWILGARARRQIRESNGQYGGDGKATAGFVLGIIGTVLLILALIVVVIVVVVAINDPTVFDDTSDGGFSDV